ncbi:MAG: hypothetical protein KC413_21275 [Anaerolineales bacterium]|nr:hypothetical protein [Anaerolineales bacterium]
MRRYLISSLLWVGLLTAVLCGCTQKSANTPPAFSILESTPSFLPTSTPESIVHTGTATPTQVPSPKATIDPFPDIEAIDESNTYWLDTLARFGVGHIFDVTFSPDQSLFAVYTGSGIYLYDRITFAEVNHVPINMGSIEDVIRFMPNGRQLLFSVGSSLMIWDFTASESLKSFQTDVEMFGWQTTQIDFTFDGNYMIQTTNGAGSSGAWAPNGLYCEGNTFNIAVFNLATLTKTHDRYECQLAIPRYRITENGYIQFFTGSWMLPSYPNYPMKTVVVDPQTGAEIASAQKIYGDTPFDVLRIETSGDVSLLPTEEELLIWNDEQRLEEIPQLFDPPCNIQTYVGEEYRELYADEQTSILTYGDWRQTYKIAQWNKTTCTIEKSLSYQSAQSVQFSPTGSMFIIENGTGLEIWDLKKQTVLFTIQAKRVSNPISFFRFSEDESRLFTGSHGYHNTTSSLVVSNSPQAIEIWDTATGEKVGELQPAEYHFYDIELTHKPEIVLTFDEKGTTLWNIETETRLNSSDTPFPHIYAPDPLRDGVWFARNSEDCYSYELFLVDVNTGEIKQEMARRNGEIYRANAILGSPALYLFERQWIVNVLDVESEQVLWQEKVNHAGYYRTTNQGELYATSYGDWTQFFSAPDNGSSPKFAGAFVTTSQSLLITEFSSDYLIWDRTNAGFIDKISSDYDIADIAISPDSHFIVIVTSNGQIEIMGINRDK